MNRTIRGWFTAAAALTLASVVMGAVVCATESGASCSTWPGCSLDQFLPRPTSGLETNPLIEFTHRVIAGITGPTVLVAAILGRRLTDPRPRRLAWIGLAGTLSAGLFGMLIVLVGIPWWLGVLDLASALVAMVGLLYARVLLADRPVLVAGRTLHLARGALGTLVAMHLLTLPVAGNLSYTRCMGWPTLVLDADHWPALQWLRIALAAVATLLIVLAAINGAVRPHLRVAALLPLAIVLVELRLGLAMVSGGGDVAARAAHSVTAVLVLWSVALLAALSEPSRRTAPIPVAAAASR